MASPRFRVLPSGRLVRDKTAALQEAKRAYQETADPVDGITAAAEKVAERLGISISAAARRLHRLRERGEVEFRSETGLRAHVLKVWPQHFQDLLDGHKTHEVRRADRDYRVGDLLDLREWEHVMGRYTGRRLFRRVSHLLRGPQHGITEGYVVLSLLYPDDEAILRMLDGRVRVLEP